MRMTTTGVLLMKAETSATGRTSRRRKRR